jgi:23S rRNA (cytidine1920-2'-O)/16S rRNA (cytidine1409-2'-O)-methyltransferase
VGYGLIHWKLRNDPRVIIRERENIRYLDPASLPEKIDLVVIDLSFISLKLVLPAIKKIFKDKGEIIALIKPQFEVGKGEVGKGGIVREKEKQDRVIVEIKNFSLNLGFSVQGVIESPISGQKGNKEFFIYSLL